MWPSVAYTVRHYRLPEWITKSNRSTEIWLIVAAVTPPSHHLLSVELFRGLSFTCLFWTLTLRNYRLSLRRNNPKIKNKLPKDALNIIPFNTFQWGFDLQWWNRTAWSSEAPPNMDIKWSVALKGFFMFRTLLGVWACRRQQKSEAGRLWFGHCGGRTSLHCLWNPNICSTRNHLRNRVRAVAKDGKIMNDS